MAQVQVISKYPLTSTAVILFTLGTLVIFFLDLISNIGITLLATDFPIKLYHLAVIVSIVSGILSLNEMNNSVPVENKDEFLKKRN